MAAQASSQSASSGEDKMKANRDSNEAAKQTAPTGNPEGPKKPSKLKALWAKTGLDLPTVLMMVKGSLPPTIAISMYQSTAMQKQYGTLGYLVAIMSILGFCIMPRGKFLQTMSLNILSVCLAAAINLLALYTVTQARLHTTIPYGKPLTGYNASASAVCAIWLMVQVYFVNVVRAARPQFQFPAIIYSIFVNVSMTYGTRFPTMASAISFMEMLMEGFLTGFALASAVSLLVLPMSSRKVVMKEMTGYLMSLNGMLKAQTAYMRSLEDVDPVEVHRKEEEERAKNPKKKAGPPKSPLTNPASLKLKELLGKTIGLHTKLHGDITPAKREFAFGKLESHDLTELWKRLRSIFVPVIGLAASMDLTQRLAAEADWSHEANNEQEEKVRHRHINNLHFLMKQLHGPFAQMTGEIDSGIKHVLITLEMVKAPKKKPDEESKGDRPAPGTAAFTESYKKKVDEFYRSKKVTLADWCKEHDIHVPEGFWDSSFVSPEKVLMHDEHVRERYQRQLFFTLYLEYLLWRTGCAVLDLMLWADSKKQDGTMDRSKLIFPGSKTLYDWVQAVFSQEDLSNDNHTMSEKGSGVSEGMDLGKEFALKRDPEHLPPQNARERIGDAIRIIPQFFRSDASAFGFRVVAATMSIAIICYLEASQTWFLRQRLLWAMIMVAISMSRTAGQSTFNFALRVLGTTVAMTGSYIIWYIVDGHTVGVIIFLWLWITCAFYFILKMPKLLIVAILSLVTSVLVIGYELQVQAIGVKASEANGQPAYPTYLLAPYRLACVSGGLLVAFIWTIFPYPISESTELRKDLGASLYLMSNFYSIVHETVRSRVSGTDGDANVKGTHAYNLDKARNAVFNKLLLLLNTLKTNESFSKFQLRVGGRFPQEEYHGLIESCQRLMQYTALLGYASSTFSMHRDDSEAPSQWSVDFRKVLKAVNTTSHRITSLLSLLSSSLSSGQPLPPYLEMPKPFHFVKQLESMDPDLLSIRHVAEPEMSAFAVIQVCASAINKDLEHIVKHVKTLVGELDFTFHAVKSSKESTDSDSIDADEVKGKAD